MAVERIIELVTHRTLYPEIQTQLHFIKENCYRLMNCLTSLEASNTPLACSVFNTLEDLRSYLLAGVSKTRFGEETDRYLSRLGQSEKRKMIKSFQSVFKKSSDKLNGHLDRHPAYSVLSGSQSIRSSSASVSFTRHCRLRGRNQGIEGAFSRIDG